MWAWTPINVVPSPLPSCLSIFCNVFSEKFSFSEHLFLSIVQLFNIYPLFCGQKHLCLCSLLFNSLLWVFIFFHFFKNKNKFPHFIVSKKTFSSYFLNFLVKKCVYLLKTLSSPPGLPLLFSHSCLFCVRNDTDISRGWSVAASRLISFLVSSSCFQCFLFC